MLPCISFHQSTSILPIADRDRPVGDIRGPDPRRASGDVPFTNHSHTDPARQQVPMDILYFHDDLSFHHFPLHHFLPLCVVAPWGLVLQIASWVLRLAREDCLGHFPARPNRSPDVSPDVGSRLGAGEPA